MKNFFFCRITLFFRKLHFIHVNEYSVFTFQLQIFNNQSLIDYTFLLIKFLILSTLHKLLICIAHKIDLVETRSSYSNLKVIPQKIHLV